MFPALVLIGLGATVTTLAAQMWRRRRAAPAVEPTQKVRGGAAMLVLLGCAANVLLFERAGFVIAAATIFWLTARAAAARKHSRLPDRAGIRLRPATSYSFAASTSTCRPASSGAFLTETIHALLGGFAVALTPVNLLWALAGVTLGTFVGVLPGLGPALTVALLLPATYGLDPAAAFIMFAGIYYGGMSRRIDDLILLNTPGRAPRS